MGLSIWQIALVAVLVILLFGRGKLSGLMTDLADGIKGFRQSMKEDGDGPEPTETYEITEQPAAGIQSDVKASSRNTE